MEWSGARVAAGRGVGLLSTETAACSTQQEHTGELRLAHKGDSWCPVGDNMTHLLECTLQGGCEARRLLLSQ